ncbi:hypothetical protein ALC60_05050 [Trachymyrmex zeteki]|uniref:Uncharacterized protein n=1 Tax=Mycetomoellerius zeteki TaxID=64791 RepID=A0A151X6R3_9HYME|nr:PREDICTED: uncharacterized protein LOC108722167 [Trachymyrmex zeteki]KYQ56067.1 hypothetical protein ALC60_05050 [Trachymyrmex zeteki]
MSRIASHQPLWPSYIVLLLFILILTSMTLQRGGASPLPDFMNNYENTTENSTENSVDSSTDNSTITSNTDVYVIKAVVYEIGILADTDNTTSSESTERQEKIDISLYSSPQEDEFS